MGFGIDYENISEDGIMPVGYYEVVIKEAYEDMTRNGKNYISIPLVVRNDVEQSYKNKYIWHSIWKRKDPSKADLACNGYSSQQINIISKAVGLQNGKRYESIEDWCNDLSNRVARVKIKHEEFNGKISPRVQTIEKSKFVNCNHQFKNKETSSDVDVIFSTNNNTSIDLDKDCPF